MPPSHASRWSLSPIAAIYLLVGQSLAVSRVLIDGATWQISNDVHTLLEAITATTALIIGSIAMVRFYAKKSMPLLLAGVAFAGASFFDGLHALVSTAVEEGFSGVDPEPVAWSWFLSRIFLGSLLIVRGHLWQRRSSKPLRESRIFLTVMGGMAAVVALFFLIPLPPAQFPGLDLARPQDLVAATVLAVALYRHLAIGAWREDLFENCLILALIFSVAGEALFMPFSRGRFDAMLGGAHVLKLASNVVVLFGLMTGIYTLFREAEEEHERVTFGFLENVPSGILILDAQRRPYYANEAAIRILGEGVDPERHSVVPPEIFPSFVAGSDEPYPSDRMPLLRALQGEWSTVADLEVRRGDERIPLQVQGAPVLDGGGTVAFALIAFQEIKELRRVAMEDPLTGLANRLAFNESYGRIAAICERAKEPLCIALLDLDRFKSINDNFGHDAGDQVLRRAAQLISSCMRTSDLVARWGGEEIVVLAPYAPLAGAMIAVERALEALRKEPFEFDGRTVRVTFSAGVVEVARGTSLERAVSEADKLLYRAKAGGRDRVVGAG